MMTGDPNVKALIDELERQGQENATAQENLPLRRILGIDICAELYGLDIQHITEIVKLPAITFVPGAPPHILGVTSLRGLIVPVVNMRVLLNLDPAGLGHAGQGDSSRPAKPRVVVLHHEDIVVGLLVDGVAEVYDVRAPVAAQPGGAGRGAQLREGHLPIGDREMLLLNVPAIFRYLTEA